MRRGWRIFIFVSAAIALFFFLRWGYGDLPPVGHYQGPYGDVLNRVAVYERHATNVVMAVNFDYRAFDTLGEEFILFISVVGCAVLLRTQRQEQKDDGGEESDKNLLHRPPDPSEATKIITLSLIGPLVVFGIYMVTHGHLTPGGGFQGGVILATAPLLVYLAGDLKTFKHVTSHTLVKLADAAGALGYVMIGFVSLMFGMHFLQNFLPLGKTGAINSAGIIALISIAVGLEVAGAFVLLLHAFLEQTLEIRLRGEK